MDLWYSNNIFKTESEVNKFFFLGFIKIWVGFEPEPVTRVELCLNSGLIMYNIVFPKNYEWIDSIAHTS